MAEEAMMAMWVKIRSWHRVSLTSRAGWLITLCGRTIQTPLATADELPMDEKSCESCLRRMAQG